MQKIDIFLRVYNKFKGTPFIYFRKWLKRRKLAKKAFEQFQNEIEMYE